MAKDYQESVIRLDHDGDYAEVWTERRGLATRLLRLGFTVYGIQGRGVWYRGGIKQISFRKAVNRHGIPPTAAKLGALAKAREAKREATAPDPA